jgi:hypothetical protein
MEITENSLKNMLRHAYLFGANTSRTLINAPDDWEKEREDDINELIADFKKDGKECYSDFPCDCTPEELKELGEKYIGK